jgi:surface polysaccharide O-acyltransferase-like enzyme
LLIAIASVIAFVSAFSRPSLNDVLLGITTHKLEWGTLNLGEGGIWRTRLPTQPIPLEEAGELAVIHAMPGGGNVGLYAHRFPGYDEIGKIEIVSSGHHIDITSHLQQMAEGESRFIQISMPEFTKGARVEVRPISSQVAPVSLYDIKTSADREGFTLESGGGNTAYLVDTSDQLRMADAHIPVVRGTHITGGYSVLVLSGENWAKHDLRNLRDVGGFIEIDLMHKEPPPFVARLIGPGQQSADIPLYRFNREPLENRLWRYRFRLANIDWGNLSAANVSGLALAYSGPLGAYELRLNRASIVPAEDWRSGVGILAVSNFSIGGKPLKSLFAAGPAHHSAPWLEHQSLLRVLVAVLVFIGSVGFFPIARSFWLSPVASAMACIAGPAAMFIIDKILPNIIIARPEHNSLILALLTIGIAIKAYLRQGRSVEKQTIIPMAGSRSLKTFIHMDALKVIAMVGIIGIHVSSDPAGTPYETYLAEQRLFPVLMRAFSNMFGIAIFIAVSFFLLAHSLSERGRPYSDQVGRRLKRLLTPFIFWSVLYIGLRFFKANVFGYVDALRTELSELSSLAKYAFLGSAQYHLHFLPFLAGLTLLYPLFNLSGRRLWTAVIVLLTTLTAWHFIDAKLYAFNFSPEISVYIFRATKTFGFLGFGALAFAVYRSIKNGKLENRRWIWLFCALAVLALSMPPILLHSVQEAAQGQWLPPTLWAHLGRHLLMACFFIIFMISDKVPWPAWIHRVSALTYGVYLLHPFVLDLIEIGERHVQWSPAMRCMVNLVIVSFVSFGLAACLARIPSLRWTIGLERNYR